MFKITIQSENLCEIIQQLKLHMDQSKILEQIAPEVLIKRLITSQQSAQAEIMDYIKQRGSFKKLHAFSTFQILNKSQLQQDLLGDLRVWEDFSERKRTENLCFKEWKSKETEPDAYTMLYHIQMGLSKILVQQCSKQVQMNWLCHSGTKMYFAQSIYVSECDNHDLIQVLVHENIHSLIRYFCDEKSKKYPLLQTDNGELIKAGEFYEMQAHDKQIIDFRDYCLQQGHKVLVCTSFQARDVFNKRRTALLDYFSEVQRGMISNSANSKSIISKKRMFYSKVTMFYSKVTIFYSKVIDLIINQEHSLFEQMDELIKKIHTKPELVQEFLLHLIIAATRVWEAYNKDGEGNYCFQIWTSLNNQI